MGFMVRCGSRAAMIAAFFLATMQGVAAQEDVTLFSREGSLAISGRMLGYDGEFYRIETEHGALSVDGQAVICEGPACPDLVVPRAQLRIVGDRSPALPLLPHLFRAFAQARGLKLLVAEAPPEGLDWAAELQSAEGGAVLADLSFVALGAEEAAAALSQEGAELRLSAQQTIGARVVGLEALAPVVAPDNPTPAVSTAQLAQALSGEVDNWIDLGGPDMPIILHGLAPQSDIGQAMRLRIGVQQAVAVVHEDLEALARAVVADPWALALTTVGQSGGAMALALHDSCGFPLLPSPMAVKNEDYPLALPVFLQPAPRRLPLIVREFLDFLATPAAETAVARSGLISRAVAQAPMTGDGLRLLNAIRGAGDEITLADLKRLAAVMEGAQRLSLTFRFDEGTALLDAASQENLETLAALISTRRFAHGDMILAGFSDGTGTAAANLALSQARAQRLQQDLHALAPDLAPEELPRIEAFGEILPMACDETLVGRRLNRRVELWLRPNFTAPPDRP